MASVLLKYVNQVFTVVWLGVFALGVVTLVSGGITPPALIAGAIAAVAMGVAAWRVASLPRLWARFLLLNAPVWLVLPGAHALRTLVAITPTGLDDAMLGMVVAGGPGTSFTANLGLSVAGAALVLGVGLRWWAGRMEAPAAMPVQPPADEVPEQRHGLALEESGVTE